MLKVALLCLVHCLIAGARVPHLHNRRQDSSTSSDTSTASLPPLSVPAPPLPSAASSSYLLYFYAFPGDVTTCQPATFKWMYLGPASERVNISIISDDNSASSTTSDDSSNSRSRSRSTSTPINFIVANNIDPSFGGFTWTAVSVPEGWYKLNAVIPAMNYNFTSPDNFYVQPGDDDSCLSNSNSGSSVQSRASRSVGAIIGGVLGGAAFILAAAIILLFYRRNRLVKPKSKLMPTRGVYPDDRKWGRGGASHLFSGTSGSWDHLGSVDSHGTTAVKNNANHQPYGSFADSVHIPVLDYSHARSPTNGEEEMGSPSSLFKSPIEDAAALETSLSIDAQHDVHRRRRLSDASSLAASTALSHVTGAAAEVELGSSSNVATNPTPKAPKSRKATRKPVPSYDPSTVPTSVSSSRTSASPLSEAAELGMLDAGDPFARPAPAVIHKGSTSSLDVLSGFNAAVAGGNAHYVSRTHSQGGKDRELNHKSSFGGFEGRPLHYLMPDMPLPPK